MKLKGIFTFLYLIVSLNSYAEIRLWVSNDTNNGNFGGRAGLDNHCDTDLNKPNDMPNSVTRAFISVTDDDEIRDMPTKYRIPSDEKIFRRDGTTQIAANFAALLDTANNALTNSVDDNSTLVWNGSEPNGEVRNNCNGWTSTTLGEGGSGGRASDTNRWYLIYFSGVCSLVRATYCMTYTPIPPVQGSSIFKNWE